MRKSEQTRPYPPDFVSAETLAYRLDCSVRAIQDYAKSGLIPKPLAIGNLVRWNWTEVQAWIERQGGTSSESAVEGIDEYSAAIRNTPTGTTKAPNDRAS